MENDKIESLPLIRNGKPKQEEEWEAWERNRDFHSMKLTFGAEFKAVEMVDYGPITDGNRAIKEAIVNKIKALFNDKGELI